MHDFDFVDLIKCSCLFMFYSLQLAFLYSRSFSACILFVSYLLLNAGGNEKAEIT